MLELKIDPEFRDKIPAMPQEDFEGLRQDILRDGYVRDPLVVWKEENTLLDGHHRWRIIQDNANKLGDKFKVDYKSFPDRWACIAWICANQLHKHNMTEMQRMKLIQEEHDARQKSHGGDRKSAEFSSGENRHLIAGGNTAAFAHCETKNMKTRAEVAKEHGISPDKVRSAVEVGRGIDRAAKVDPDFKKDVLTGLIKANKGELAAIRKLKTDEEVKEAIEEIKNPKPRGWTKEDRENRGKLEAIVADMYDPTTVPEFTLELLIDDIQLNAKTYVDLLRNTLTDRSTLLTAENKPKIAEAITKYVIKEIEKVRELVET